MGENSKIEWTDHTFNPWVGCTKVSPGCDHCYAEAWDRRFAVSGHAMRWGVGKKAAGRHLSGVTPELPAVSGQLDRWVRPVAIPKERRWKTTRRLSHRTPA